MTVALSPTIVTNMFALRILGQQFYPNNLDSARINQFSSTKALLYLGLGMVALGYQSPAIAKKSDAIPHNEPENKVSDSAAILTVSLPPLELESATSSRKSHLLSQSHLELKQNKPDATFVRDTDLDDVPEQIVIQDFNVVGSSVFSQQELATAIKSYRNRPLTLPELFQARSAITKLYTDKGYVNSGAYIPPQELNDGTVKIAVLEGKLEGINVSGTDRLTPKYVSSRIEAAAGQPVNVDSLLAALQLLRLDPLISNVSAELSAGIRPGTSLLDIEVEEADVFNISTSINNKKSPSVGSNQRSASFNHGNLLGIGDRFNFTFSNTSGSNGFDFSYSLPFNAKNGTIAAAYGSNSNDVVEEPFVSQLDLESESRYFELSLRQPVVLQPNREFALGLSFSRGESETFLDNSGIPLSRGAEDDGETKISAIRFFQEYVNRDDRKVLAFRSQFSFGLDVFDATSNDNAPDSTFFAWRGQSQWVRKLDEDFLFLLRGDVQIAGGALVPLEQFRIGGVNSARGYRQDLSLGDSGVFGSAELRIPILRFRQIDGLVQLAPFFDIGTLWNTDEVEIANATLPSVGLGLNLAMGDRFNARLDWGIPLTDIETEGDSLQEDGVHFSLDYDFF
ncbi:MAG: ShlB/FhaC/HecB family hemolysin secretion/activation protein [Cyanobacteria bacterium P01_G01_bin.19]